MAQTQKYTAELLLKLKAEQALADARKAMRELLSSASEAETGIEKMLSSLNKKYDLKLDVDLESSDLKAEVSRIAKELQASGQGVGIDFSEATADAIKLGQAIQTARAAEADAMKGANEIAEAMERAVVTTKEYENAAVKAGAKAANSHVKTTLASQNVIRIIQDMPYGMMGITNNIQSLGDSMGYLMNQTEKVEDAAGNMVETQISAGRAMQLTLKGLLSGPMAFSLLITLLTVVIQKWDAILNVMDSVKSMIGLITKEQRALNAAIRDMAKEVENSWENRFVNALKNVTRDSYPRFIAGIEQGNEVLEAQIDTLRNRITPEMQAAAEARERMLDVAPGLRLLGKRASDDWAEYGLTEETRELVAEYDNLMAAVDGVQDVIKEREGWIEWIKNAETVAATGEYVENMMASMGASFDEAKEKVGGLWFEIRQMQIDQLPESLSKLEEQIILDFDEMIDGFDRSAAGYFEAVAEAYRLRSHRLDEAIVEWNQTLVSRLDARLELQEQRIAAEIAVREAYRAGMEEGYRKERETMRDEFSLQNQILQSQIETAEAQRNLFEEGTDEWERYNLTATRLYSEQEAARLDHERAIVESYDREAQAIADAHQSKVAVLRRLEREEAQIAAARAQTATGGGAVNVGRALDQITAQQRMAELSEIENYERDAADIRERFHDDEIARQRAMEAAWRNHMNAMQAIEEDSQAKRRQAWGDYASQVSSMAASAFSGFSQAASTNYETWKSLREQELDELGVTEEAKAEIIEKEGAKQFENQKKLQIAEAWINGLSGAVAAISSVAGMGPFGWALGAAQAAAIMALTKANVNKIRAMKPGGGAGGGGGGTSFGIGSYAALNAEVAADRVAGFETWRSAGGFSTNDPFRASAEQMQDAASRFEATAANLTAVVEPRDMGQIARHGRDYLEMTNGNS